MRRRRETACKVVRLLRVGFGSLRLRLLLLLLTQCGVLLLQILRFLLLTTLSLLLMHTPKACLLLL